MVDKMTEIQTQREQLFSDISHELRNPLTVLRVNIEGIMENKIQVNQKKLLQINDQIILLSKLIDDLSLIATAETPNRFSGHKWMFNMLKLVKRRLEKCFQS